jgi:membrane-bound lytic murein transglycosylase A
MGRRLWWLAIAAMLPFILQCGDPNLDAKISDASTPPLVRAAWEEISAFREDVPRAGLRVAAENSLKWLQNQKVDLVFRFGLRDVARDEMIASYQRLIDLVNHDPSQSSGILAELPEHFDLLKSRGQDDGKGVLATGYYVPAIEMRSQREPGFEIPVYRTPTDSVRAVVAEFGSECTTGFLRAEVNGNKLVPNPAGSVTIDLAALGESCQSKAITGRVVSGFLERFWTRSEIRTTGVLANRGLELGWVASEVDLFFIEIQGSASLVSLDQSRQTLNYEGANGRPYRAIGKLLVDEGRIPRDKISMQTIRQYLAEASAEEVRRVLDYNESFVFFRQIAGGARGCFDFEVTADRTVALDQSVFPANAIGFLDVERPSPPAEEKGFEPESTHIRRIIFNQDTGGAIKGPGRVDLFWGAGESAASHAGVMQTRGQLYLFMPKL